MKHFANPSQVWIEGWRRWISSENGVIGASHHRLFLSIIYYCILHINFRITLVDNPEIVTIVSVVWNYMNKLYSEKKVDIERRNCHHNTVCIVDRTQNRWYVVTFVLSFSALLQMLETLLLTITRFHTINTKQRNFYEDFLNTSAAKNYQKN